MLEEEAALYEAPFEYVRRHVSSRSRAVASRRISRPMVAARAAAARDARSARRASPGYIATSDISKHRLFVWLPSEDARRTSALIVIARDDDYTFGVLHSRVHELWARAHGNAAPRGRVRLPLHPHHLLRDLPLPAPHRRAARGHRRGRPRARPTCATAGSTRPASTDAELASAPSPTSTTQRPTWLANAHAALDVAVFAAYGWPADLPDDELLARLLALNLEREPA